jgi:hypothetical protein
MSDPLPSGGVTERTAFDGYSLQVFPKHQYSLQQPSIYLSSNSDLCDLEPMFKELQQKFDQDRQENSELLSKDCSEGLLTYSEPFVDYAEKNGIFMAIVGFASYSDEKFHLNDPDCYPVDSVLFVWADSKKYGGNFSAFWHAVDIYAIDNKAGLPSRYRTPEENIDHEGYSLAIQHTVDGGAQEYPPYCNHEDYFEDGQPRTPEFTMGPEGRQARISFLNRCFKLKNQNG